MVSVYVEILLIVKGRTVRAFLLNAAFLKAGGDNSERSQMKFAMT